MTDPGAEPRIVDADQARSLEGDISRAGRARRSAYRSRFAIAYVALGILTGLAVAAFVVLLARPDSSPEVAWSAWTPTGSNTAKVRQIADHVAAQYRLDDGNQLAAALAGSPRVAGQDGTLVDVGAIAVLPDTSKGQQEEDDVDVFETDGSIHYILCGLGQNCSIASGTASEARHTLLRREALELALYTFKYVDDSKSVIVTLPPRPDGQSLPTSLFFRPHNVSAELKKPLSETLSPSTPRMGDIDGGELSTLNRITSPLMYQAEYQPAQNYAAIMILQPLALGA